MNLNSNQSFSPKLITRIKIIAIILILLAVIGIGMRIFHQLNLKHATQHQAVLNVSVIKAKQSPSHAEIILPANVQAWHAATIYARTNGYVVNWQVDIGSHVKKGDLLAEISAPEVNAQLRQAEADLKTAIANNEIAKTTSLRWKNLLKTDSVSKQETEEKISQEKSTAAIVVAAKANRDKLLDLVSFQKITAPFDGVIMSRNTDIGRLINAGSGNIPLFTLVQTHPLRVYVRVPEYYSSAIQSGLQANIIFPPLVNKKYPAILIGNASAIDMNSRTLLLQFKMDNSKEELLAGSYAEIHLKLPTIHSVILPVNTLIFRSQSMQVAAIDQNHKAFFKSIQIGNDYGNTVEVISGVKPDELIILNPPDSLLNGQALNIISDRQS